MPLKEQTLGGRQLDLTELRGQASCEREAHRRAGRVRRGGEREETCVMNSGGNQEHLGEFARDFLSRESTRIAMGTMSDSLL